MDLLKEAISVLILLLFSLETITVFDEKKLLGFLFLSLSYLFNSYLSFKKSKIKNETLSKIKNPQEINSIIPWYYMLIFNVTVIILMMPNFGKF